MEAGHRDAGWQMIFIVMRYIALVLLFVFSVQGISMAEGTRSMEAQMYVYVPEGNGFAVFRPEAMKIGAEADGKILRSVTVQGYVKHPGVYFFAKDVLLTDVLKFAGKTEGPGKALPMTRVIHEGKVIIYHAEKLMEIEGKRMLAGGEVIYRSGYEL